MGAARSRRNVSLVILVGMIAATTAVAAVAADTNLALNRPFRCSVTILTGWDGLTDGVTESDSAPGCFATANVDSFPRYITVDLGAICQISRVAVHNSANGNTKQISIECSTDNLKYQPLRQAFIFIDHEAMVLQHEFKQRQARYVRITLYDSWKAGLGGDNCLFLRELEVFGQRDGAAAANPPAENVGSALNSKELSVAYPSLRIFRRYCLQDADAPLRIAVIGDSSAIAYEGDTSHWTSAIKARITERFGKTPQVDYPSRGGLSLMQCDAYLESLDGQTPDLFIVSIGHDAAIQAVPVAQFRAEAEEIVAMLCETTDALVIVVTPAPVIHNSKLGMFEPAAKIDSAPYAWQIELLARNYKLPLVRAGVVLDSSTCAINELYTDNMHLSERGHAAIAIALDILLADS